MSKEENSKEKNKEKLNNKHEECCCDCCTDEKTCDDSCECCDDKEECKECCKDCEKDKKELEEKLKQETEGKLRALADFQNYKKRTDLERREWMNMASYALLSQLVELMDNVYRAESIDGNDKDKLLAGYKMMFDKVKQILSEQGLEEIKIKVGDKFDPNKMEALTTIPVEQKSKDSTVIHVESKGYKNIHKNNNFRTAKVVIGKHNK
jgi:molecular chaperone GrpE